MANAKYKALGHYLKTRRLDWRGTAKWRSQSDVAERARVSQPQVSKLESGRLILEDQRPEDVYDLLLQYDLSPARMLEIADEYSLDAFREYIGERTRMYGAEVGKRQVRFLGVIGAGRIGASWSDDEKAYRAVPDRIANKYRLEDVFVVEVDGTSMISDDAAKNIPPCSEVFFHSRLTPEPGEIVCVYLPDSDHTVLKQFEPSESYTVLRSHNNAHAPIVVDESTRATVQGVYLTHYPVGSRLR